jgi:hypothetical protein
VREWLQKVGQVRCRACHPGVQTVLQPMLACVGAQRPSSAGSSRGMRGRCGSSGPGRPAWYTFRLSISAGPVFRTVQLCTATIKGYLHTFCDLVLWLSDANAVCSPCGARADRDSRPGADTDSSGESTDSDASTCRSSRFRASYSRALRRQGSHRTNGWLGSSALRHVHRLHWPLRARQT